MSSNRHNTALWLATVMVAVVPGCGLDPQPELPFEDSTGSRSDSDPASPNTGNETPDFTGDGDGDNGLNLPGAGVDVGPIVPRVPIDVGDPGAAPAEPVPGPGLEDAGVPDGGLHDDAGADAAVP